MWRGHSAREAALDLAMGLLASNGQLRGCWPTDSWESNSLGSTGGGQAVANLCLITTHALWVGRKPAVLRDPWRYHRDYCRDNSGTPVSGTH